MADSDLAGRVVDHVEGAFWRKHGAAEFVCPIDNGTAYVQRDGSIDCSTGCDAGRLAAALTFLVDTLPLRCNESESTRMAFGHMQTCPRCLAYTPAVRSAYQEVRRRFGPRAKAVDGQSDESDQQLMETGDFASEKRRLRITSLARAQIALEGAAEPIGFLGSEIPDDDDDVIPSVGLIEGAFDEDGRPQHLFYAGQLNGVHGLGGARKTNLSLLIGLQELRQGNAFIDIDHEIGRRSALRRLRMLGASDDHLGRFVYLRPGGNLARDSLMALELVKRTGAELTYAMLDSFNRHMRGLNTNDVGDVLAAMAAGPDWYLAMWPEIAFNNLDHAAKGAPDSRMPGGSPAKYNAIQGAQYLVVKGTPSDQHSDGHSLLKCVKDQNGYYAEDAVVARFEMGPSGYRLCAPTARDRDDALQVQDAQTRIVDALKARGRLSGTDLKREVGGNATMHIRARNEMVAAGSLTEDKQGHTTFYDLASLGSWVVIDLG